MRTADQTDYIAACIRDAASMYEDDARQFLAEHDARVRAEALAADGQAYDGELAMLRGLVSTLRVMARHGDLADIQHLFEVYDRDVRDATAGPAPDVQAVPGLTDRQARLLAAIRIYGGEWNTRRALALFAVTHPGVVQRGTARRDLAALQRAGHLVLVDAPDNRHYVLHPVLAGGAR
ncbi:hypothetical protein [Streptomyces fumanus]|uniref:hypothetical protein n=1 Tax=Streptomyces fumanus TaxID=67302 RepID=UPI0033D71482